jgi:hypothetical protein
MRSILPLFVIAFVAAAPALATEAVTVPQFRSVELRGGGTVEVVPGPAQRVDILEGSSRFTHIYVENDGQLRIDACQQPCPPNYRLRVQIQAPSAPSLAVDGGGQMVTSTGFAPQRQLSAAVNGGGHIDARSVDAFRVSAAVNGGGDIFVRPRAALSAAVNGGGHVRYLGNPATSVAIRGGGAVVRAD